MTFHYVMVWRRSRRYGWSSVGQNPASGSVTSGISVSRSAWSTSISSGIGAMVELVVEVFSFALPFFSAGLIPRVWGDSFVTTAGVAVLFTKRPLTLNRLSARFFLQLYRIFLFHTRRVRLLWNLAMIAALSAGVYIPIRPFLLYTCWDEKYFQELSCKQWVNKP